MVNSASLSASEVPRPLRTDVPKAGETTGVERAFSLRWTEVHGSVRHFLLGFLSDRSEVEDYLQEVALLVWRKGPLEAPREQFLAFAMGCAKRLAMASVRKKYRTRDRLIALETFMALIERTSELEMEDPYGPQAQISALRSCLGSLDPAARHLLELRYSASAPSALKEQARKSGSSMDAIYKKLERLRTLLKACVTGKLRKESDEPGA